MSKVIQVPIEKIVRCRWRDEDDSPEKISAAIERIGRQSFRGHLDGRKLSNGFVEQLNGHNRKAACIQLGLKSLPFVVKEYTDDEALDIFLSDNMKEDGQGTGWALGAVRKVVPHYQAQGKSLAESFTLIGSAIGLKSTEVQMLADMNKALDAGILSPAVKRLLVPYNAVEYWRKLQELTDRRTVLLTEQEEHINCILQSPDVRGRIRSYFCELLAEAGPAKVAHPKARQSHFSITCKLLEKLAVELRENADDFSEEEMFIIQDKVKYVTSLTSSTTDSMESQIAVEATLADMDDEEILEETRGV